MSLSKSPIHAEKIYFRYPKAAGWTLENISLEVAEGTVCTLMGGSGSGKTTLLKVLAGLQKLEQGRVQINGKAGYIPQQLGLVRSLSVMDNVLLGTLAENQTLPVLFGLFPRAAKEQARVLLHDLGIGHKENEKAAHLSGGERQRVAIARALIQKPSIILADEFISDLDLKTSLELLASVKQAAVREKTTFLLSMHELHLVKELDGKVLVMKKGRIQAELNSKSLDAQAFQEMLA